MIITSVLGSGAFEQDRSGKNDAPKNNSELPILKDALRIRDFSQDRGSPCSGCRRDIAWPPMPRFVREQSKGYGFFSLGGHAKLIRETEIDSHRSNFVSQHSHQRGILRASTGNDHLVIGVPSLELRQHEALDR
jgi:hypothetical protein